MMECPVCDGWEVYNKQPCCFCNGNALEFWHGIEAAAEEYKEYVNGGGVPSEWEG